MTLLVQETEAEYNCSKMLAILREHEDKFPPHLVSADLFHVLWAQVCTRCFAQAGTKYAGMVPMGDAPNHSCTFVTHECINVKKQLEVDQDPSYYRVCKYVADYKDAFDRADLDEETRKKNELNIRGRVNRKLRAFFEETLSTQHVRQNLEVQHVWKIPFLLRPYQTDDGTSSEDSGDDEGAELRHFERHGRILEYFMQ